MKFQSDNILVQFDVDMVTDYFLIYRFQLEGRACNAQIITGSLLESETSRFIACEVHVL